MPKREFPNGPITTSNWQDEAPAHSCQRVWDGRAFPLPAETFQELSEIWIGIADDVALALITRKSTISRAVHVCLYRGVQIKSYWLKPRWSAMTPHKFALARHRFYSGPIYHTVDDPSGLRTRTAGRNLTTGYLKSHEQVWRMTRDEFEGLALMDALKLL